MRGTAVLASFSARGRVFLMPATIVNSVSPSVRSWRLIQVGSARVPMSDSETVLTAKYRDVVAQLHNGGHYNFYSGRRAPIDSLSVTHRGVYGGCNCPGGALISPEGITEFEALKRYGGIQSVPFLFVSDLIGCEPYQWLPVYDCDCCDERKSFAGCHESDPIIENCDDCMDDGCTEKCWASKRHPCVTYAWAFGRITKMPDTSISTKVFSGAEAQEVSFEATLDSPLRRITYQRWRYGRPAMQPPKASPMTAYELERTMPDDKRLWEIDIPCKAPSCCDTEKFWPRDQFRPYRSLPFVTRFDVNYWEYTRAFPFVGPVEKRVYVGGNAEPEVMITATSDTVLSVRNSATDVYAVEFANAPSASLVYSNSATGEAFWRNGANYAPIPGFCQHLRLEPGVNVLTVVQGSGVVGLVERYV